MWKRFVGVSDGLDSDSVSETLRVEFEEQKVISSPVESIGDPLDLMRERQVDEAGIFKPSSERRDAIAALGQCLRPVVLKRDVEEPSHARDDAIQAVACLISAVDAGRGQQLGWAGWSLASVGSG